MAAAAIDWAAPGRAAPGWVSFEQPLTERMRSFLRLEFLLDQLQHYRGDGSEWGLRASVQTLLDIFSSLGRADFKTELLKELTEQQQIFQRLGGRPDVDTQRLQVVLTEIAAAQRQLHFGATLHPAGLLRENDFLYSVHSRSAIPGGNCSFDLPAYHRWLQRGAAAVAPDIGGWSARIEPFAAALEVCLRLARGSSEAREQTASGGVYLHLPQSHTSLVRVFLPIETGFYPEISAGKHRIVIRFMELGHVGSRSQQTTQDVAFRLQFCGTLQGAMP